MSRFLIGVAALAASCWLSVSTALAENRIALVIGNSSYSTVTALPNPANDARAMTKFLASAGFQVVQEPDLTQNDMRRAISNFASMVAAKGPDTVAVVFYAGHGLQVDGENYLIPIDARIEREADVPLQAMRLGDVMNALSGVPSKSRIVILDACRNNPFSTINKTGGRGLAIVDAPNGSLVSYSTAPGFEALDRDDKNSENSPFTTALLKHGAEPGAPIEQVLKRVRYSVSEATGRQQFPWESSSLISDFSFFPTASGQEQPTPTLAKAGPAGPASTLAKGGPASALAKAGPGSAALVSGSEARSVEHWRKELRSKNPREAYEIVVGEDRVEAYQAYLSLYPNQSLAPVVRTVLERRQVVVAWYQAVTINTPAAYQAFLASHGGSDYAVTADRLLQRALTRSAVNAGAAFAAACPCTPAPATPLPQRQKRSDPGNTSPSQNTPANPTSPAPTNVTGYSPPPAAYTDPAPPIVVAPPVYIPTPRVVVPTYPPRGCGQSHPPSGDGKPYPPHGDGKPYPPRGEGQSYPPRGEGKPKPPEGHKSPGEGTKSPGERYTPEKSTYGKGQDKPHKATGGWNSSGSVARRTTESPRVHVNKNVTPSNVRSSPSIARTTMPRQPSLGNMGGRGSPMGAMGMGRTGMGGGGMGKMMGGGGGGGGMGRMMGGGGMPRMGGGGMGRMGGGGGFGGFRR